jgi:transposase-like protein
MSQENKKKEASQSEGERPSRRVLSAEKKYQIFLEAQREEKSATEILRREGLYSTDLARIRSQVKEGALERLSARAGRKAAMVPAEQYERLKKELEEKERVLAEMSVEVAMLRKKTNGGTWER